MTPTGLLAITGDLADQANETVWTKIARIHVKDNHLCLEGDSNRKSLTCNQLVGALYN